MRMPLTTRDGYDEAPIEPGARWNIEPCDAAATAEVMPLDDALEALAATGADHVHALAVGEDRDADLIAGLGGVAAGLDSFTSRRTRVGGTPAFLKWPALGLFSFVGFASTRPSCTAA